MRTAAKRLERRLKKRRLKRDISLERCPVARLAVPSLFVELFFSKFFLAVSVCGSCFVGCGREKLKSGVGLVGLDGGVGYGGGGCSFEGAFGYCD